MQWDGSADGGFTTGTPWLGLVDPAARNVAAQSADPASLLSYWKQLIALRRELQGPLELLDVGEDVIGYRRGAHVVAINFSNERRALPGGEVLVATEPPAGDSLAPHAAAVIGE